MSKFSPGRAKKQIRSILIAARHRCTKPGHPEWKNYGARGITFFAGWAGRGGAARFSEHIGPRPSAAHSLDRIDNDKGYEPGNVRWASGKDQHRNTRANRLVTIGGETKCVAAWCEHYGIKASTVWGRVTRGMSYETAFKMPIGWSGHNHSGKLTPEQVRIIRAEFRPGNGGNLARRFGISRPCITAVVQYRTYANV